MAPALEGSFSVYSTYWKKAKSEISTLWKMTK
jgi:hypothetical protein